MTAVYNLTSARCQISFDQPKPWTYRAHFDNGHGFSFHPSRLYDWFTPVITDFMKQKCLPDQPLVRGQTIYSDKWGACTVVANSRMLPNRSVRVRLPDGRAGYKPVNDFLLQ